MKAYFTALLCATLLLTTVPTLLWLNHSNRSTTISIEESVKGARETGLDSIENIDSYNIGSPSNSEVNSFVNSVANIIKSLFRMLGAMLKGFFNAFKEGIS